MRNVIISIIEQSRYYPSGDNAQPFEFKISDNQLEIKHVEERAVHAFNPNNISSKLTLGLLLESIAIAANQYQLSFKCEISSNQVDANLTFFKNELLKQDPLCIYQKSRITDRRPYNMEIDLEPIKNLISADDKIQPKNVYLQKNNLEKELVNFFVKADNIMCTWKKAFFNIAKYIRFDKSDILKIGLSPENLGLNKADVLAIKLLTHFPFLFDIFNKLGFLTLSGKKHTLRLLHCSPAFLLVSMNENDLTQAGRQIMRIWILLCANGYSLQPLSASVLAPYTYYSGNADSFPFKFKSFYEVNKNYLKSIFGVDNSQQPIFLFRIGKVQTSFPENMKISRLDVDKLVS